LKFNRPIITKSNIVSRDLCTVFVWTQKQFKSHSQHIYCKYNIEQKREWNQ